MMQSSYRGSIAAWGKTSIAATTFYFVKDPITDKVNELYHVKSNEEKSISAKLLAAVGTGSVVALTSAPLDLVKTLQ